jgi:predicted amidohydrolase YtcJ
VILQIGSDLFTNVAILERNLFEIPPEEIYGTEVTATLLDGRVVFGALP